MYGVSKKREVQAMDLGLKDKVALVTGASRGIGYSIALALADEGAHLCICARSEDKLKAAAKEIAAKGVRAECITGDLTEEGEAERFVETARQCFDGFDILVNNVGGSIWTPFMDISDGEWLHIFNLTFLSAVRVSRAAIPIMEHRGGGSIINISSIYGREIGGPISYNAAKSAMISMTSNLAQEVAKKNIRVNSLAPGSILFSGGNWERRLKADPEGIKGFVETNIPFGRFGKPEEVAAVVTFLASKKASWVTGACINVDGGQSKSLI